MEQGQNRRQRPGDGPGERGEGEAPPFRITKGNLGQALTRFGQALIDYADERIAEEEAGPAEGAPEDTPEAREPEAEAVVIHLATAGYPGGVDIQHGPCECVWCDAERFRLGAR